MSSKAPSVVQSLSCTDSFPFHERILLYILVLLSSFILVITFLEPDRQLQYKPQASYTTRSVALEDGLVFFSIGDWGRRGSEGQTRVAETMASYSKMFAPRAIISTGDNFYEEGITSPIPDGLDDDHFQKSFIDVYSHDSLRDVPWYIVAGNNDIKGHLEPMMEWNGDTRWHYPSRNYTMTWELPVRENIPTKLRHQTRHSSKPIGSSNLNEKVTMIFLDSSPYIEYYYDNVRYLTRASNLSEFDREAQLTWVRDSIIEAKNQYNTVVVVSHHPLYSPGQDGGAPEMKSLFGEMFRELGVDIVLSGHNHLLAYSYDGTVEHIVSGGGSEFEDGEAWEAESIWKSSGTGFVIHSFTTDRVRHSFIDGITGRIQFQKTTKIGHP